MIVRARDAEATLPRTLAALARQQGAPAFEVVVVDDGSRDLTADIAERAGVRVLRLRGAGPAAARNRAAAASSGALLAFCDADCYPRPGWLAAGARALEEADLVQGRVAPDPRTRVGPYDHALEISKQTGLYDAANLFVRRALFDRVGGFEERQRPPAADARFAARVSEVEARTAFAEEALAHRAVRRRDAAEYLASREHLRRLPALVAEHPELRSTLLYRRLFRDGRAFRFDIALVALALGARHRSCVPLVAATPYALELRRHARERARDGWPRVAAVDAAADLAGLVALARGSVAARTLVL